MNVDAVYNAVYGFYEVTGKIKPHRSNWEPLKVQLVTSSPQKTTNQRSPPQRIMMHFTPLHSVCFWWFELLPGAGTWIPVTALQLSEEHWENYWGYLKCHFYLTVQSLEPISSFHMLYPWCLPSLHECRSTLPTLLFWGANTIQRTFSPVICCCWNLSAALQVCSVPRTVTDHGFLCREVVTPFIRFQIEFCID